MTLDSIAEAFELLDFKSNEFPEYDVEHAVSSLLSLILKSKININLNMNETNYRMEY